MPHSVLHRPLLAGALLALAVALPARAEGTARSIDQARGVLKTPEARAVYDREIRGAAQPDGLGVRLPEGFTAKGLLAALVPGGDPAALVLAGARPWPARPDSYVAIVCVARSAAAAANERKYWPDQCRTEQAQAWFGVFERGAGGQPRLLARTREPVEAPTSWAGSNLDSPQALEGGDTQAGMPESWLRFDLAPYRIRDDELAFGVRAGWSEGYAGGGASFEALYLFRVDGEALRVVFTAPMMYYKMIAGDWNKDGTRNHDMYEGSNLLNVQGAATAGFHDLQLRERGGKWRRTYRWSEASGNYVAR